MKIKVIYVEYWYTLGMQSMTIHTPLIKASQWNNTSRFLKRNLIFL